ncbi:hypothetical protein HZH66_012197 [Vespula vulgaris]|uniref:Uncharacterized protein n=1 Tax=Vespula vulgaris TaxID=7454 RepID=A0A834JGK9_VESVU|nr:hypothetical protein HZH66_012197 [Vespula vulgaris]
MREEEERRRGREREEGEGEGEEEEEEEGATAAAKSRLLGPHALPRGGLYGRSGQARSRLIEIPFHDNDDDDDDYDEYTFGKENAAAAATAAATAAAAVAEAGRCKHTPHIGGVWLREKEIERQVQPRSLRGRGYRAYGRGSNVSI